MRGEIITREEMLAIPAYEISDLGEIAPEPLVSVIVITYNHEAYIEQTIEGILAQQCDFPIELIIGEDKSKDRTLEICLSYQQKYPNIIRVVSWHENIGSNANFLRVWGRARGKYLASCEGDDYWIDPAKLTKQVALMEQYPDTTLCGAFVHVLDNSKGHSYEELFGPPQMKGHYGLEDVIERYLFHTSTFLLRTSEFKIPAIARSILTLDHVIMAAAAIRGNLRCIPDTVSVWRMHPGGIHSVLNDDLKNEASLALYQSMFTFLDERYFPALRKREDIVRAWICHSLASKGQLSRARKLALENIPRLALHNPKKALILLFHMCLPRTFQVVFDAWTRRKQPGGLIS